jgi:hypothetical protein
MLFELPAAFFSAYISLTKIFMVFGVTRLTRAGAKQNSLQALLQPVEHIRHVVRPVIVAAVNGPAGFRIVVNC